MANPERLSSFDFQENPGYADAELSPPNVARSTSQALDFYFNSNISDKDPVRDYLKSYTLEFLGRAEKGFLYNIDKIDKTGVISTKDYAFFESNASKYGGEFTLEDTEAFGYSIVTFSALPEIATSPYLPNGYSRRGVLAPPQTCREFYGRIDEMREEILKISDGVTDPGTLIEGNNSLLRTYTFFEAANQLPLNTDEPMSTVEQQVKDVLNNSY